MIEKSSDRTAAILAAWNTGKIVYRQVALRQISRVVSAARPLTAKLESMVLAGTLDADMNVRETALGLLQSVKHPATGALAAAQLTDPDPHIRLLGLNHLKYVDARIGIPIVIPLLDENDPFIVSKALKLLENWTGEKFGVKLSDTVAFENEKTGLKEFREDSYEKAKAGASRAKSWWAAHQSELPSQKLAAPKEVLCCAASRSR